MEKYEDCCCYRCSLLQKNWIELDCGCGEVPVFKEEKCENCPKKEFCDVAINPYMYPADDSAGKGE
jgi:hypothetical protein